MATKKSNPETEVKSEDAQAPETEISSNDKIVIRDNTDAEPTVAAKDVETRETKLDNGTVRKDHI